MARYFFDLDGARPYTDEDGMDLPSDAAAWVEAKKLVRDIESHLEPGDEWHLEVRREDKPIYRLTVSSKKLETNGSHHQPN